MTYTFEIFKTFLSGRDNDKLNYKLLEGDNIFYAINRAWNDDNNKKKVILGGEAWFFDDLISKEDLNDMFLYINSTREEPKRLDTMNYYYYFNDSRAKERFISYLTKLSRNKESFFGYSSISDFSQHLNWGRKNNFSESKFVAEKLTENMFLLKSWIDFSTENSKYLLIIADDHGHDEFSLFVYLFVYLFI